MSSSYESPQDYIFWYLKDDEIAIVTTNTDNEDNQYESIDEDLEDAVLVEFSGDPTPIDPEEKNIESMFPNVSKRLHFALLNYIIAKLYLAEKEIDIANTYYSFFTKAVLKFNGGKPRPEVRITIPDKLRSLR